MIRAREGFFCQGASLWTKVAPDEEENKGLSFVVTAVSLVKSATDPTS